MVGTLPPLLQHIRSGRIKSFGVANSRVRSRSGTSHRREQGYLGFDSTPGTACRTAAVPMKLWRA